MADICVIGAGPAGCVFAARMAQLGHRVRLVEQERFPRLRLGESLTPGVQPLLKAAGLEGAIEASGARRVREVSIEWADGPRLREDQGLLVDRGAFDLMLLERSRGFGVEVRQPARVLDRRRSGGRWRIVVEAEGRREAIEADFVADARGRSGTGGSARRRAGAPTLAVFAYWRGVRLPDRPRIEAGAAEWFWGVPLPNGLYNTLAFIDPKALRAEGGDLTRRFLRALARSRLMQDCRDPGRIGPARAIDATPYVVDDPVDCASIRLGDAALAIDPLSSSGVQKAVRSALSGAIVANTILRKPERAEIAISFYRDQLADASESHRRWAAEHYGAVADARGGAFWAARAEGRRSATPPAEEPFDGRALAATPLELSPHAALVATPCLAGEYVDAAPALVHPRLARPVAYLGGCALAPLLEGLPAGLTPLEIARWWSDRASIETGLALAGWLIRQGVLVRSSAPVGAGP